MYEINSTTIIDHSKRKGLKNSLLGLITVRVNLTIGPKKFEIIYVPDASNNYELKFSEAYPGAKELINMCSKTNISIIGLTQSIKEFSNIQSLWREYVSNLA